jgi:hypothetical protein
VRSKTRLITWVLCGLTAFTACGLSHADSHPPAPRELTAVERDLLRHAEQVLIGACMRRKGFAYVVVPPPEQPAAENREFPTVLMTLHGHKPTDLASIVNRRRTGAGERQRSSSALLVRAIPPTAGVLHGSIDGVEVQERCAHLAQRSDGAGEYRRLPSRGARQTVRRLPQLVPRQRDCEQPAV